LLSIEKNSTPIEPGTTLLFLADVHLGAGTDSQTRDLEQMVIDLIRYCEDHKIVPVILGDLFDYWMEYPSGPPPLGEKLLRHFRDYHKRTGNHTLFVTGNHDNWTFGYLEQLGFDVEPEYRVLLCDDENILVLHGDGLQDRNMKIPRPFMHRLLRNSYFITIYQKLLSPQSGWKLMRWFSNTSRKHPDHPKCRHKRNLLDNWAEQKVTNDPDITAVVYGHHHQPRLWQQDGKACLNCGSLSTHKTVGLYTNKTYQLVTWVADRRILETAHNEG